MVLGLVGRGRSLLREVEARLFPWVTHRRRSLLLGLLVAAAVFRIGLAARPGLWGDEIFSLAMATGHSLEHPAAEADTTLGDYVEAPDPLPPAVYGYGIIFAVCGTVAPALLLSQG